jgi:hypothetical protein
MNSKVNLLITYYEIVCTLFEQASNKEDKEYFRKRLSDIREELRKQLSS